MGRKQIVAVKTALSWDFSVTITFEIAFDDTDPRYDEADSEKDKRVITELLI